MTESHSEEVNQVAKYQARIEFNADTDEAAKSGAKSAARAVSGKVANVLAERLTFRSIEEEAAK